MEEEEIEQYYLTDGTPLNERANEVMKVLVREHPIDNDLYPWNDIGLSELFGRCYDKRLIVYCPQLRKWYYYDKEAGKWTKDEGATMTNYCLKEFSRLLTLYAVSTRAEDGMKKNYINFVNKLGNRSERERVLKDAESTMSFNAYDFDKDPYLINCKNGTYNLKSGKLLPFDAEDYLTLQTNCNCPSSIITVEPFTRFDDFISEIMCGDRELTRYLKRCLGYSLSGVCKEEKMFMFYGQTTRNGKSTLINTILNLLGDYAKPFDIHNICKNKYGSNNPSAPNSALCGLMGTRFVALNESDESSRLDEAMIKNYTGNDPISTRQLYGEQFTFVPQFTMFISGNNLPDIMDKSVFSSERIVVIPFNRHFNKEEQDRDLKEKFMSEEAKTYIFKWLLDGYKDYTRHGLIDEPKCVEEQIAEYERDNDIVALFTDDRLDENTSESERMPRQYLYSVFKDYCDSNGIYYPMSSTKFYKNMERLGYNSIKSNGTYYILGVKLRKKAD